MPGKHSNHLDRIFGSFSIYDTAPELLMEAMLDLTKILINYKETTGEDETYKLFKKFQNTMQYAHSFIRDIEKYYRDTLNIKNENDFLRKRLNEEIDELNVFKIIEREILKGTLDNKIEVVKQKIDKK